MGCTVREKRVGTNRRTRSVKPESDNINTNGNVDESVNPKGGINGLEYCTEEQLEKILLKNLEFLYGESMNKLVSLGYDEEVALKAILRKGHCYGGMDVLSNILHNSLAYLNGGNKEEHEPEPEPSFADLRQLEEYSLAGMVCLLQQVKPHLTNRDALWCLLMSDLHVGRASVTEIPVLPSPTCSGSSRN